MFKPGFQLLYVTYYSAFHPFSGHRNETAKFLLGSRLENRAVRFSVPMRRRLAGIIISCERLSLIWSVRRNWYNSMKADLVSLKNDATIQSRRKRYLAVFYILVPNLMSPPQLWSHIRFRYRSKFSRRCSFLSSI